MAPWLLKSIFLAGAPCCARPAALTMATAVPSLSPATFQAPMGKATDIGVGSATLASGADMTANGAPAAPRWFAVAAGVAMAIIPLMFGLPLFLSPRAQYAARRLMEIGWAALLIFLLLSPAVRIRAWKTWAQLPRSTRLVVSFFVAWSLVSALVSPAPRYAVREWSLYVLLAVAALPMSVVLAPYRRRLVLVLAVTLAVYGVFVLIRPAEHGFSAPRFQGQALAVTTPVLLFGGDLRLALFAAAPVAAGVLEGSRGLVLALAATIVAAVLLWPGRKRRVLPALVAMAVAALLVAASSVFGGETAALQDAVARGTGTTGRIGLWTEALSRFVEHPILGVGPGMLARAPGLAGWAAHPHNVIVLILAETGLGGLACAGVLTLQGALRLPRLPDADRPWALALVSGAIHAQVSGTVIMPASQALLLLALAVMLSRSLIAIGSDPSEDGKAIRHGWILLVIGALALVIVVAGMGLPLADVHGQVGPRFWPNGLVP